MISFLNRVPRLRNRAFFLYDLLLLPLCVLAAFAARFEGRWSADVYGLFYAYVLASVPLKLLVLISLAMYRRLWRYASVKDLETLVKAAIACAVIDAVLGLLVLPLSGVTVTRVPYAVVLLTSCLVALALTFPRLGTRMFTRRDRRTRGGDFRRAIIVGAGAAGGLIVRELSQNPQLGILPVGIVDDDPSKLRLRLHGVPVVGPLSALREVSGVASATEVIVAMPSASGRTVREVVHAASNAGLRTRTVPGLYEILSGEKRVSALRQIEIEDLLRREPIVTDIAQVGSLVRDKVVMVTGAGGSIGSELCRQLARLEPARIIALGRGENSIFELLQEFARIFPATSIEPVIADVRDHTRIMNVIAEHRPYSVFHAAAHKHVPLMEANVAEAVLNNVLGTQNVVSACSRWNVEHFVLISTDKAVRPTSVMGATKRIAEHIVHQHALRQKSGYVAVRFGNVLGSRGSVVPTFMRQIGEGGPVTITHRDMTRYFMTIPEAVQLVLQAAALGTEGEVFVLDMGEPVRVYDLATDLIRLSGLEPDVDIEVRVTGTRPGEKLYEELFFSGDHVAPTIHPKILRSRDAESLDHDEAGIVALIEAARDNRSPGHIRRLLLKLVPEYAGGTDTDEFEVTPIDRASSGSRGGKRGSGGSGLDGRAIRSDDFASAARELPAAPVRG